MSTFYYDTAIAFVLAVEDPSRIDGTRNTGAYFGLVPGRDQSGDCDKQLGISKTGNPYIRKLLVQWAQYILGAHGPDCDLKRFGERRAGKSGEGKRSAKGAKRKAIVAVARKLAQPLLSAAIPLIPYWRFTVRRGRMEQATSSFSGEHGVILMEAGNQKNWAFYVSITRRR